MLPWALVSTPPPPGGDGCPRSLLAFWVGGAGIPVTTPRVGFRNLLGFWAGGAGTEGETRDRSDPDPHYRKRPQPYREQKKLYYRQLQDELDRQLEAKAETEPQAAKQRRIVTEAVPQPELIATPPMLAGEATRIVQEMLAAQATYERDRLNAALNLIAEEMARQQDEEDALAVMLLAFA